MAAKKHIFINMNGALTKSGERCSPDMKKAIMDLAYKQREDIVIISDASYAQMKKQLTFIPTVRIWVLAEGGTHGSKFWRDLWKRKLNSVHHHIISEHIRILKSLVKDKVFDENALVEDRGGQISYSIIGHDAPQEDKEAFDPTGDKRREILSQYPLESNAVTVSVTGLTSLTYTATGWSMLDNIAYFISMRKWSKEDCVLITNKMYEGEVYADLLGLLPYNCYSVSSPDDALTLIRNLFPV